MLFGGGLVEGRALRTELHVDGFTFDLIGPYEIGAVAFGGIAVAGALRPSALHHSLQDRSLQKIVELLEFLQGLAETLLVGCREGGAGWFARGHDGYRFSRIGLLRY